MQKKCANLLLRMLPCLVVALMLSACGTREEAAYLDFSARHVCPREDIRVTLLPDIDMKQKWLDRRSETNPPPAEIKADPKRLTIWQAQQDQLLRNRRFQDYQVFQVSGCGHEETNACQCRTWLASSKPPTQATCSCTELSRLLQ